MKEKEDESEPDKFEHIHATIAIRPAQMLRLSLPFVMEMMKTKGGEQIAKTFFELGPDKGMPIFVNALHSWFATWLMETQQASNIPVGAGLFQVKSATSKDGSPFGMHDRIAKFDDAITFGVMKNSARMLELMRELLDSVQPSYDADGMRTPSGGHIPQRIVNKAAKIIFDIGVDDGKSAADMKP